MQTQSKNPLTQYKFWVMKCTSTSKEAKSINVDPESYKPFIVANNFAKEALIKYNKTKNA